MTVGVGLGVDVIRFVVIEAILKANLRRRLRMMLCSKSLIK